MIWFAEAYRWQQGSTWLGLLNPQSVSQVVTVSVLGKGVTRTVALSARSRAAVELGEWGVTGDFGVEVKCASVCAASLVMWDQGMKTAHESLPILGCETHP